MLKIRNILLFNFIYLCIRVNGEEKISIGFELADKICDRNFTNVSEQCAEQLIESCKNGTVLMNFLDAGSKFPYTGMAVSSRFDFGNYDQCVNIDYDYEGGKILGKFCLAGLIVPDFSNKNEDAFRLAICIPDQCLAKDYQSIFEFLPVVFQTETCVTKETGSNLTPGDIVGLTIFGAFGILMTISTTYDVYLKKKKLKNNHRILLAFSVYSNCRKLLQTSRGSNKEQILCFQGMKIISMMWIVLGHGMNAWENLPVTNKSDVDESAVAVRSFWLTAAPMSVETFFYISGFLTAFLYLKKQKKVPLAIQMKNIPYLYIHRYFRLTPAVIMLYVVCITFFSHLGSGPIWKLGVDSLVKPCKTYWWTFFLYIQNYVNYKDDEICLIHTWYLSADMQMFLLSPLLLIPLTVLLKKRNGLRLTMIVLALVNIIITAISITLKLIVKDYVNNYDSHTRLASYTMGIMMGTFLRETNDKPFLHKKCEKHASIVNFIIWVIVLAGMAAICVCYKLVDVHYSEDHMSVFVSIARLAWSIGLSWIVYSSYHGYGGIVNWILSRPMCQIGAKLNYCIYIVHGLVVASYVYTRREKMHYSYLDALHVNWGYLVISLIVAFCWTMAFESPLIILEKYIFAETNRRHKTEEVAES